jgi:hypothetical protein
VEFFVFCEIRVSERLNGLKEWHFILQSRWRGIPTTIESPVPKTPLGFIAINPPFTPVTAAKQFIRAEAGNLAGMVHPQSEKRRPLRIQQPGMPLDQTGPKSAFHEIPPTILKIVL